MANLNVNKVIYGGDVLIDLTGDSVSADKVLKGITTHDKSGAKITVKCYTNVVTVVANKI